MLCVTSRTIISSACPLYFFLIPHLISRTLILRLSNNNGWLCLLRNNRIEARTNFVALLKSTIYLRSTKRKYRCLRCVGFQYT